MSLKINIVLGANTVHFDRGIKKATADAEKRLKGLAGIAKSAFDKIGALNLLGGSLGIANIIQTADAMQQLASKVRINTQSTEEYKTVLGELRDISRENYASFDATVGVYASSKRALDSLGKSQQEVLLFTENITKAMAVGGGSAAEQQSALTQLGQALSMGALKGQEFNSVAAQAPVLIDLLTDKLGVSIGELKKMGSEGKITADIIYQAVADAGGVLDAKIAQMPVTISQALGNVAQEYKNLVHDIMNESTQLSSVVVGVLDFITQNFRVLTMIAGAGAAVFVGSYVKSMLLAKLGIQSLTGAIAQHTGSLFANSKAVLIDAYSLKEVTATTATLTTAKATLAKTYDVVTQKYIYAGLTLQKYGADLSLAAAQTAGYIRTNFTLANAKRLTTAAFVQASGAVTGYISAKRTALVASLAYTKQLFTINGAKTALTNTTRAAIASITGFGVAIQRNSIALAGYTRALVTSTTAKRALIGTANLAIGGVRGLGGVFASLGRIIMAHPIMIIGGVIVAIVARTMGLQKAMESLSDAVQIVGLMLGELLDVGIEAFKGLLNWADKFLDSFLGKSGETTGAVSGYFSELFKGTKGGFVGVLQAAASMFDKMSGFAVGFVKYALAKFNQFKTQTMNLFRSIGNAFTDYFESKINGAIDTFNAVNKALGGDEQYISHVQLGRSEMQAVPDAVLSADGGTNLRAMVDGFAETVEQNRQATNKLTGAGTAAAKALGGAADAAKGRGKADKNAKDKTEKLTDAQKALIKAIKAAKANLDKLKWDITHPRGLETEKIDYEYRYGSLRGMDRKEYEALYNQALDVDTTGLVYDFKKQIADANTMTNSRLDELISRMQNPFDKLSLMVETGAFIKKTNADGEVYYDGLNQEHSFYDTIAAVAKQSADEFRKPLIDSSWELEQQLAVLDEQNEFARARLKIEQEYANLMSKTTQLAAWGFDDLSESVRLTAEDNKQLQLQLLTKQRYQEIVESLTSEEEKQLVAVREKFAIIADADKLGLTQANGTAINQLNQLLGFNDSARGGAFGELQAQFEQRMAIVDAFNTQMADAYQGNEDKLTEITKQAEAARTRLKQEHAQAQIALTLSTGAEMLDGIADHAKAAFGEQSTAYRAMFALQKGFAIAQSALDMQQNISKAMATGFPQNIPLIAAAVTQGAKIIATIRAIRNPVVGQAHDGIMSVPKSGTWNLEKGERVLPKHTAKALDAKLDSIGNGAPKVIINNYSGEKATAEPQADGSLLVTIGQIIDTKINQRFNSERRQGGMLHGR